MKKFLLILGLCSASLFHFAQNTEVQNIEPTSFSDMSAIRQVFGERYFFNNLASNQDYHFIIEPSASFSCLGMGWKTSNTSLSADKFYFTFRTKDTQGNWSEWLDFDADFAPDETPTEMYWTDLLFTIDATNHIAIEVKVKNPTFIEEMVLDIFDGNVEVNPNPGVLKHTDLNAESRSCPPFPTIIPRSDWCGGSAPCSGVNASYSTTNINATHIVMHHGASPNTYTDGQTVVRNYWNYHVNSLGWADIGYNYLIDKYGNFYQGRRNLNLPTTDVRGAHAGAANGGSIGINFLGNLDVSIATTPQLNKLHELLAWWFNHKSYDPTTSAGMQTQAYGWQTQPRFTHHNAINPTACPGTDMISRMPAIRNAAKAIIDACSSPADTDPPSTIAIVDNNWQSNDFWVDYNDSDPAGGTGVAESYYQVLDFDGTEWRGNHQNGFFSDNFTTAIHPEWTQVNGTWGISSGHIRQSNQTDGNSNIYAPLTQNNQNEYLYQWQMNMAGTGTNRRAGLHFFIDNPNLPNRGNSYLAWWRVDNNKFQFYKITNDVLNLVVDNTITVPAAQWMDCKVTYNPTTGVVEAYMDNVLVGTYTDATPLQSGTHISLRNGDSDVMFDDVKVRINRENQTLVTVGNAPTNDVRYESPNSSQDACRINTIVKDGANNWSTVDAKSIFIDWTLPTTNSNNIGNTWKTADFNANYTDADNNNGSGLDRRFYQVSDFDGSEWSANTDRGFFYDNFDNGITTAWTSAVGTWNSNAGAIEQTDENENNSNIYAPLNQNLSNRYYYNFDMKIEGSGTNRRAGFHYFCDQPNLTNRGNSYFVWFRVELQTLEFFKVSNDTFSQEKVIPCITNAGQNYNIGVTYDRITGETSVYRDGKLIGEWTDASPILNGDYVSFRSGNCKMTIDNFSVYRTRTATPNVLVGNANADIRYQNPNPTTPSAKLKSITSDFARNLSIVVVDDLDVDWTPPSTVIALNDGVGTDIDNQTSTIALSANWVNATDAHSGIAKYWYAIGTSAGATDIVNWTDNGNATSFTHTGLSLSIGSTYYVTVRSENGAGLVSADISTNGVTIDDPGTDPIPGFSTSNTSICNGESIQLTNTSVNATSYSWITSGGTLSSTTDENPTLTVTTSGSYTVQLIAFNATGNATTSQNVNVTVFEEPVALGTPSVTSSGIGEIITFTNQSTDATDYFWNFDDGNTSTDVNPWNSYNVVGIYNVMLVASNGVCPNDTTYMSIEIDDFSSVTELESTIDFTVVPNPNNGVFDIVLTSNTQTEISIALFDITGKIITQIENRSITSGKVQIPMNINGFQISEGVYLLMIQSEVGNTYKRIMIQNN